MQSLEQEVSLEAISSISGTVRNSETSTKSFIPYLELQKQMHVGTRMYLISNFNNVHAFTNGLLSTCSYLKWECLHRLNTEERLCAQNSCVHSIYSTKSI